MYCRLFTGNSAGYMQSWIHISTFPVVLYRFYSISTVRNKTRNGQMDGRTDRTSCRDAWTQISEESVELMETIFLVLILSSVLDLVIFSCGSVNHAHLMERGRTTGFLREGEADDSLDPAAKKKVIKRGRILPLPGFGPPPR